LALEAVGVMMVMYNSWWWRWRKMGMNLGGSRVAD